MLLPNIAALKVHFCIFMLTEYVDSGISIDVSRRLDEHGRGGLDNIATQMNQAANRGMDVRARYAPADNALEARAQELFLLDQRNYSWNSNNNGGIDTYWWR
jgi:chemotaxis regulatin CheY-phosphate phosphatase CheZ